MSRIDDAMLSAFLDEVSEIEKGAGILSGLARGAGKAAEAVKRKTGWGLARAGLGLGGVGHKIGGPIGSRVVGASNKISNLGGRIIKNKGVNDLDRAAGRSFLESISQSAAKRVR